MVVLGRGAVSYEQGTPAAGGVHLVNAGFIKQFPSLLSVGMGFKGIYEGKVIRRPQ